MNDFGPSAGSFGPSAGSAGGFPELFFLVPVLMFVVIVFVIISSITRYAKNSSEPLLQVPARVVAKRTKVSGGSDFDVYPASDRMWPDWVTAARNEPFGFPSCLSVDSPRDSR